MAMSKAAGGKRAAKSKINEGFSYNLTQVCIYIFVGIFSLSTILPFLYVVAGSFSTERQLTENPFFIIPKEISFNAYEYIAQTGEIFRGLGNSFFVTVVGTLVAMALTSTFAYPLSRKDFRGRNGLLNMVIVTMIFSGGMIPTYLVVHNLGLTNTFGALILPNAINAFNMVILKNFFQGIPTELEEAATLDGCSDIGIFFRIVLPLSKAAIASISLFYAVSLWNDYFNAMIYITDPAKEVAQVVLRRIVLVAGSINTNNMPDFGQFGAPPEKAVKLATTVVATIPILCVYPFVQKYFTQGVMVGAVKG
ncbi:MAG: carbohydrate ABC transporter permease [Oscillospiraceae bacterium]